MNNSTLKLGKYFQAFYENFEHIDFGFISEFLEKILEKDIINIYSKR